VQYDKPHPADTDRLRQGFATALARLNDKTARAVIVIAVDQHPRSCAIWHTGDLEACGQMEEAIRKMLYTPRNEGGAASVSRETPKPDEGYKPKTTVDFGDGAGPQPSDDLEQELLTRVYRQPPA